MNLAAPTRPLRRSPGSALGDGLQDLLHDLIAHPLLTGAIFLALTLLSLGDLVEIIPAFAPLTQSPLFPYIHETHDLLALMVAVYGAYRVSPATGTAAITWFLLLHAPYFGTILTKEFPEFIRFVLLVVVTLFVIRQATLRQRLEAMRRLAVRMEEEKQAAVDLNRAKSEFLSRMSHELRTPMNAILGFAQVLEMDGLTAEQRESVQHILAGGKHLLHLINEVLDITSIEARRLPLLIEPVRLGDVLRESLALIAPLLPARQLRAEADIPAQVGPLYVRADRQRLKQVLLNLLSNAVMYNREGGRVTLSCQTAADERVLISIRDTGHGISPVQLKKLFSPFERLGASGEGTGLGLALSKSLIEAMDGAILVTSTPGEGTTFVVVLPLAEPIPLSGPQVPTVTDFSPASTPR